MAEPESTFEWASGFVAALLFLGLGLSSGASWMWYRVISSGELIHLNGLTLLGSTFATALAFVVYRESLDVRQLVGIVATLVRVIMLGQRIGVTAADHAVS